MLLATKHALVEWTAFGPLDKLDYGFTAGGEGTLNSLTGQGGGEGAQRENWFRIDSDDVDTVY